MCPYVTSRNCLKWMTFRYLLFFSLQVFFFFEVFTPLGWAFKVSRLYCLYNLLFVILEPYKWNVIWFDFCIPFTCHVCKTNYQNQIKIKNCIHHIDSWSFLPHNNVNLNTKWAWDEGNKVIKKRQRVTEGRREGLRSFHSHPQFCYPAPGVPSAVPPPENAARRSAAGSILEKGWRQG